MNAFSPAILPASRPDPTKHVNYALGMVLGVDDLNQEFAYLAGRDQWMVRDLIGYGTVWGLAVATDINAAGHQEVRVSAGVGVDPRGQLVRVAPAQCADLHDWLAGRTSDINHWIRGDLLDLYLVLSYRDCQSDLVPIAGEPCRTADESMAPSRITDSFALELRFTPPIQTEEDSVVDVVAWLRQHVSISDSAPSVDLAALLAAMRAAVVDGSPPRDFLDDTAPGPLTIHRADLGAYLRAVFRLWVTELRPRWRPGWFGDPHQDLALSPPQIADADSLLLARLTLPLTQELGGTTWNVAGSPAIGIDESRRPYLLDLRFLQELLLEALGGGGAPAPAIGIERPTGARVAVAAAGVLPCAGPPGAVPTPTARRQLNNLRISQPIAASADGRASVVTFAFDAPPIAPAAAQMVVTALLDPGKIAQPDQLTVLVVGPVTGASFSLRVSKNGAPLVAADLAQLQINVQVLEFAL